jgi:hypothetical protein
MILEAKNEVWRPVKGFEGLYEVSDYGNVRSVLRGNKLKSISIHPKTGYGMLILTAGINRYSHRLVAESFLPKPNFLNAQVNHKDGNKINNHVSNLEWVTASENIKHGFKTGLIKSNLKGRFLGRNSKAKKVVVIKDCAIIEFETIKECIKYIHGSYEYIAKVVDSGKFFKGYLIYSV